MLKFYNYDIVCQEIPDEVTLALNITNCQLHCPGCHSKWLWEDVGEPLSIENIDVLLGNYGDAVTCVCFMGGDCEPAAVNALAIHIKEKYPLLKTAWYSGLQDISNEIDITNFDYIKVGPYIEKLGGLKSPSTNQHLYRINRDGSQEELKLFRRPL